MSVVSRRPHSRRYYLRVTDQDLAIYDVVYPEVRDMWRRAFSAVLQRQFDKWAGRC